MVYNNEIRLVGYFYPVSQSNLKASFNLYAIQTMTHAKNSEKEGHLE